MAVPELLVSAVKVAEALVVALALPADLVGVAKADAVVPADLVGVGKADLAADVEAQVAERA